MNPNQTNQERYAAGIDTLQTMVGEQGLQVMSRISEFFPDFGHTLVAFGFGDLYARGVLDLKQREIITITSLITQGAMEQLPFHLHAALNVGLLPEEILETILHCGGYAGFPKACGALEAARKVFAERGITLADRQAASRD
ncbi:4-carboxymuconolactone decarboxylase [Paenibacillus sp. UNCCL117]|uniref:carboxymuconolactone decarboxylase family protein n=1 Tax=unclassified Paenibacillus TaxID=185978 RepID=UPI000886DDAA|nr:MULTISPECIES: carboxymuconolactone decarboxylase family protein [unclassified Paenibacillus]SDD82632.1 4-carboxymuconolactone decarboxylase [Paenibacillus sp. cl123]SFW55088.1 4-carboxymuconolactone decarboxylase [Paenibacillus sp. UNCCL117]